MQGDAMGRCGVAAMGGGDGPHVGLEVRDLFAQELFYRTVLGFELVYRYSSRNTPGLRTVMLRRGGIDLELLAREGHVLPGGSGHFALVVEDVDRVFQELVARDVPGLEMPRDTGDGFRECALLDPEGNRVELGMRIHPFRYRPLRGAIFDLDGTLVDSESNYCEADCALLQSYGADFTPAMKLKYVGYSNETMMRELRELYGIADDVETLVARKNALYLEIARKNTPVFPEMQRLLECLEVRGIPRAVATGSSPGVVREVLSMTGLKKFFDVVLSSDDVGRSKPAPDVFLEAARRLGTAPDETVVFEDSVYGVEAAVRGGFRCVAMPAYPEQRPRDPRYAMADLLVEEGMNGFSASRVLGWMDPGAEEPPGA